MATGNFCYVNRCVVVTNDDFELDNIPNFGRCINLYSRCFSTHVIEDFEFFKVIITTGYYEDACIDYIEDPNRSFSDIIESYIGTVWSQKELFEECRNEFHLSRRKLLKICGNVNGRSVESYIQDAIEKIGAYLAELEEVKVNKYIDGLKQTYGYDEVRRIAVASNGETFYQRI